MSELILLLTALPAAVDNCIKIDEHLMKRKAFKEAQKRLDEEKADQYFFEHGSFEFNAQRDEAKRKSEEKKAKWKIIGGVVLGVIAIGVAGAYASNTAGSRYIEPNRRRNQYGLPRRNDRVAFEVSRPPIEFKEPSGY